MIDLEAIRKRRESESSFFDYHPLVHPCACGSCNPTAHPDHPLHGWLTNLRADIDALLAYADHLESMVMSEYETSRLHGDAFLKRLRGDFDGR